MGNGIGVSRRPVEDRGQISAVADSDGSTIDIVPNQNITSLARIAEAKAKFLKVKGERETAVKQIHGTNFIKEMYHRLDPTIALPKAIDITGEIQIAVKYNKAEKLLLLKLIQARHLVPRDAIGYADPYAVVEIVPDRYHEGTKRSARKIRTLDPVFQEIFSFALEEEDISQTKLSVDLFDHDIVGTDDFMGQAIVDISRMNLCNELTHNEWLLLQQQTDFSVTGEVEASLYHHIDTLYVTIHQAKDLFPVDQEYEEERSIYITIHIPFTTQNVNTKTVKGSVNHQFDETIEFEFSEQDLHNRTVILHIYQVTDEKHEDHLGDVIINLKRYKLGEHTRNWYRVSDLRNDARERSQLGENAIAQEFREAMFAHTLYHCPSFMFNPNKNGKKVYTVTCRQATASSRMVLVNGNPLR